MKNTLHHKVRLSLFADNSTGEYGMAPAGTIEDDTEFNSTWTGIMAFHDVFEHYCEHKHKWFQGNNAMNIGGEMFAMGHFYYYTNVLGVHNRYVNPDRYVSNGESMIETTLGMVEEACVNGYTNFGSTLNCGVPFQKDTHHYDFESYLDDYYYRVKQFKLKVDDDYQEEYARTYKKSVTDAKIKRLHRAGFYAAQKLVPDNNDNRLTLVEFIEFWDNFTKQHKAEELYNYGLKHIDFEVYIDEDDRISWKAFGIRVDAEPIEINEHFYMDELFVSVGN